MLNSNRRSRSSGRSEQDRTGHRRARQGNVQGRQLLGRWRAVSRRTHRTGITKALRVFGSVKKAQIKIRTGLEGDFGGINFVRGGSATQVTTQRLVYFENVHFTKREVALALKKCTGIVSMRCGYHLQD